MKSKVVTKEELKAQLFDGMSIMVGGFMACGTSETLIDVIIESGIKDLTLYCNDAGFPDKGIGRIIANGQCKKLNTSHIGLNPIAQEKMNNNEMVIDLIPQGTLAEQIRAGGSGLGGVLTPTGLGTEVANGKKIIEIDGKEFLLEKAFKADLALIYATEVDKHGNCKIIGTTRNFNPLMAMAANKVFVGAEKVVDKVNPNEVLVPGVLVDCIIEEEV